MYKQNSIHLMETENIYSLKVCANLKSNYISDAKQNERKCMIKNTFEILTFFTIGGGGQ